MAIDLRGALDFINKNGDDFQKNCVKSLVGIGALEVTLKHYANFQNADGGWTGTDPDYQGECSSVICTMIAMSRLEQIGVTTGKMFDATISYLKGTQKPSGGWDESLGVLEGDPPPWYYPKVLINQIWITNGVLRYLISMKPEETEMIFKARGFVRKLWAGECFPGDVKVNNWMGIVNFYDTENNGDRDIYNKCMENLRKEIKELDMGDVCWAMNSLMYLNISQNESIIQDGLKRIEDTQLEDGGFTTNYEDFQRVGLTIDALKVYIHYDQDARQHLLKLMKERNHKSFYLKL